MVPDARRSPDDGDCYAFAGPFGEQTVEGALRSNEAIRVEVSGSEAAGVTELYLVPTAGSVDQVDRLADIGCELSTGLYTPGDISNKRSNLPGQ